MDGALQRVPTEKKGNLQALERPCTEVASQRGQYHYYIVTGAAFLFLHLTALSWIHVNATIMVSREDERNVVQGIASSVALYLDFLQSSSERSAKARARVKSQS